MRLNTFGSKFLAVAAVGMLVAACSSDPAPTASTGGAGGASTAAAPAASIAPGTVQDFQVNVGDRVFFDYDKFEVKPAGKATLDKQAAWLKRYGQWKVVIEGHVLPGLREEEGPWRSVSAAPMPSRPTWSTRASRRTASPRSPTARSVRWLWVRTRPPGPRTVAV